VWGGEGGRGGEKKEGGGGGQRVGVGINPPKWANGQANIGKLKVG